MSVVPARLIAAIIVVLVAVSCASESREGPISSNPGQSTTTTASVADSAADDLYPEVVAATATLADDGTWTVSATVSSPYDTPERYADAWRVLTVDGTELAVRELTHDHAGEQPFTRSLGGVVIPADVEQVIIEGRDQLNGWGGPTAPIDLVRP
ncbi:MAG: hypothetical protein ACR2QE_04795 [Acidimicrobiales bacterium]